MDLPDINLWLAITIEDHPHHEQAKHYWTEERSAKVAICRITMLGYVRLLCNSHVMGGAPMTTSEAWQSYETLKSNPATAFLSEKTTFALDPILKSIVSLPSFKKSLWTDAYLAALAIATNSRIVSFDSDFNQNHFPNLHCLQL